MSNTSQTVTWAFNEEFGQNAVLATNALFAFIMSFGVFGFLGYACYCDLTKKPINKLCIYVGGGLSAIVGILLCFTCPVFESANSDVFAVNKNLHLGGGWIAAIILFILTGVSVIALYLLTDKTE